MEKTVRIFGSLEEADQSDASWYMTISPEERLKILIELRDRHHPDAAEQGLARVSRIIQLEQS